MIYHKGMNFMKINLHTSYAFNGLTSLKFHGKYTTAYSSRHEIWNISKISIKLKLFHSGIRLFAFWQKGTKAFSEYYAWNYKTSYRIQRVMFTVTQLLIYFRWMNEKLPICILQRLLNSSPNLTQTPHFSCRTYVRVEGFSKQLNHFPKQTLANWSL